jgi:hypothetical protein
MRSIVQEAGQDHLWHIDSAGTQYEPHFSALFVFEQSLNVFFCLLVYSARTTLVMDLMIALLLPVRNCLAMYVLRATTSETDWAIGRWDAINSHIDSTFYQKCPPITHKARQVTEKDFANFDYILVMGMSCHLYVFPDHHFA